MTQMILETIHYHLETNNQHRINVRVGVIHKTCITVLRLASPLDIFFLFFVCDISVQWNCYKHSNNRKGHCIITVCDEALTAKAETKIKSKTHCWKLKCLHI